MPNRQRYTNNVSNPLLKVINADSQLQENPTSTERNLNVQLFGDDSGTVRKVAVNSSGHILTDIEPDPETGLATAANQTNGNQISKSMGSEDGSTGGTQRQIHVDGSGNQLVSVVSTVNTLPANSGNSGITDDPANSFAVGMRARTDPTLASSEKFVKCDGNGALIVDASKEGIVTSNGTTEALHCMMMGTNDNVNLRTVKCDTNGVVSVDNSANTQPVEQSYSFGSEYTIINAQTIADGASLTSGEFEIQSVKNIQTILSLSVSAGGSTNYDVEFEGSLNGSDFFAFQDSTISASADAILSSEGAGIVPVRYMKVKITNKHGSGSHTFTVKGSILGATLAAP